MTERFSLANLSHLEAFLTVLMLTGAICPKCGHGTRKTSKRWAKCKKCDTRVERFELPNSQVGRTCPTAIGLGQRNGHRGKTANSQANRSSVK